MLSNFIKFSKVHKLFKSKISWLKPVFGQLSISRESVGSEIKGRWLLNKAATSLSLLHSSKQDSLRLWIRVTSKVPTRALANQNHSMHSARSEQRQVPHLPTVPENCSKRKWDEETTRDLRVLDILNSIITNIISVCLMETCRHGFSKKENHQINISFGKEFGTSHIRTFSRNFAWLPLVMESSSPH